MNKYSRTAHITVFLCLLISGGKTSLRCDLTPAGIVAERTRKDVGRYSIEISGNPEAYVPGEQYTGAKSSLTIKIAFVENEFFKNLFMITKMVFILVTRQPRF